MKSLSTDELDRLDALSWRDIRHLLDGARPLEEDERAELEQLRARSEVAEHLARGLTPPASALATLRRHSRSRP